MRSQRQAAAITPCFSAVSSFRKRWGAGLGSRLRSSILKPSSQPCCILYCWSCHPSGCQEGSGGKGKLAWPAPGLREALPRVLGQSICSSLTSHRCVKWVKALSWAMEQWKSSRGSNAAPCLLVASVSWSEKGFRVCSAAPYTPLSEIGSRVEKLLAASQTGFSISGMSEGFVQILPSLPRLVWEKKRTARQSPPALSPADDLDGLAKGLVFYLAAAFPLLDQSGREGSSCCTLPPLQTGHYLA